MKVRYAVLEILEEGRRTGRNVESKTLIDHPPASSAEVKERVELYLYSPSGPSWSVLR